MTNPFLPELDLKSYKSSGKGLDSRVLSYVRNIFAKVTSQEANAAQTFVVESFGIYEATLDVSSVAAIDEILALLNAGAARVCVTELQYAELSKVENLDPKRLVLCVASSGPESISKALSAKDTNVYIPNLQNPNDMFEALKAQPRPHESDRLVLVSLTQPDLTRAVELIKATATPIIPASSLTITQQSGLIPITELLLANATTDRADGLFTTLVTDARGIALGLVYSSKESVSESLKLGRGVYQSRKRGLWYKGETSGDVQELVHVSFDCDSDCLRFAVNQKGKGFCHLGTATCFGQYGGFSKLQETLQSRKASAPEGSYTARLFNDSKLLSAKIKEEADELCEATDKSHIAFEAADLVYFALTKCIAAGVTLEDVERQLDAKSLKIKRRPGNAKPAYTGEESAKDGSNGKTAHQPAAVDASQQEAIREAASVPKSKDDPAGTDNNRITMKRYNTAEVSAQEIKDILQRPSQKSTDTIMGIVKPIIDNVRRRGDTALLEYTHKFEKATSLTSPVIHAPFPDHLMKLAPETIKAIDVSFDNIYKFHAAQKEEKPLSVETMPGVVCSRFARPIERVGLYVPGGTAVLPSTALMLGVPAMVAGCKKIVLASPPRSDGSVTPEIVYIAQKVGAESIVLAGGAQAVAALAYGTESIAKVDKIFGPGNQFVTAGKMLVSNDTSAGVSIDMPAGPSEVLVVADATSNPAFVASDLLSQAEHGVDSQVVCIAIGMSDAQVSKIEDELHAQASALPRVDIVRGAIDHSVTLLVQNLEEAMALSNQYAPEHLILQNADPDAAAALVEHAGSVFIGPWTPESVGDYSAGVNHSLPTYGYARQYSGVNLASYVKHITSSKLTPHGLRNVGTAVMQLAKVEELEAHRRAVGVRIDYMDMHGM